GPQAQDRARAGEAAPPPVELEDPLELGARLGRRRAARRIGRDHSAEEIAEAVLDRLARRLAREQLDVVVRRPLEALEVDGRELAAPLARLQVGDLAELGER